LKHGKGSFKYTNNDAYTGDWSHDAKDGTGEYIYSTGEVYAGQYRNDKKHGTGETRFVNGDVYTGDFVAGLMHGRASARAEVSIDARMEAWRIAEKLWMGSSRDREITISPTAKFTGRKWLVFCAKHMSLRT
jgi:hypothetical protein